MLAFPAGSRDQDWAVAGRWAGRILPSLVESGNQVPRPALGVILGGLDREILQTGRPEIRRDREIFQTLEIRWDREIFQTLCWGSRPEVCGQDQDRAVAGRWAGRILPSLVERGNQVPRPALGVVLGGLDREISQTLCWGSRP